MIFDAGTLLAILYKETGADEARKFLPTAKMSAVNRAEVVTILVRNGMAEAEADFHVTTLLSNIVPLDSRQSTLIGGLWPKTCAAGLSLGDRACLALGIFLGEPVLTTDGDWKEIDVPVEIRFLR